MVSPVSPEMSLQSIQSPKKGTPIDASEARKLRYTSKDSDHPEAEGFPMNVEKSKKTSLNSPPKNASGMICISRSSPEFPMLAQAWKPPQVKVGKGSTQWSLEENLPVGIWHLWGPRLEFKRNSEWSNTLPFWTSKHTCTALSSLEHMSKSVELPTAAVKFIYWRRRALIEHVMAARTQTVSPVANLHCDVVPCPAPATLKGRSSTFCTGKAKTRMASTWTAWSHAGHPPRTHQTVLMLLLSGVWLQWMKKPESMRSRSIGVVA